MPKVNVDVDVDGNQQLVVLQGQVINLQQSLDRLRQTSQGGPTTAVADSAQDTTRQLQQLNQQLTETNDKLQQHHSTLLKIGSGAWSAYGAYDTARRLPEDIADYGSKAGTAYGWMRRHVFGSGAAAGAAEGAAAATSTAEPAVAAWGQSLITATLETALPVALAAWAVRSTNRAANEVQGDIWTGRLNNMSAGRLNDLRAMQLSLGRGASPDSFLQMYQGTDSRDANFRAMASRWGIPVDYGEDDLDVMAKFSRRVRGTTDFDERTRMVQQYAATTGTDPGQAMKILTSNLSEYTKRLDEVNREVDPTAVANLTKFKDALHEIWDLPLGVKFEIELYGQKLRTSIINAVFGDSDVKKTATFTGTEGSTIRWAALDTPAGRDAQAMLDKAYKARDERLAQQQSENPEIAGWLPATKGADQYEQDRVLAGTFAYWGVSSAREQMEARGIKGYKMSYGKGQTLDLSGNLPTGPAMESSEGLTKGLQSSIGSLKEATEWANKYLATWSAGQGLGSLNTELSRQKELLNDINVALQRSQRAGYVAARDVPLILERDTVREKVAAMTGIQQAAVGEEGAEDRFHMLAAMPVWTPWQDQLVQFEQGQQIAQAYRIPYGQTESAAARQFRLSRLGRRGQIMGTAQYNASLISNSKSDDPVTAFARAGQAASVLHIAGLQADDVTRQQRIPEIQQRYQLKRAKLQINARAGNEEHTAKEMHDLEIQEANEIGGLFPENEDFQKQVDLQRKQAANQLAIQQTQIHRSRAMENLQYGGRVDQQRTSFELGMLPLTMAPGQQEAEAAATMDIERAAALREFRRQMDPMSGVSPADAMRNFILANQGAQQNSTRTLTSYRRGLTEQALQYRMEGIQSTAQYTTGRMQRWALPGTELQTAGAVNAVEALALEDRIRLAGTRYTPAEAGHMRSEEQQRGADRVDQARWELFMRSQQDRVSAVQNELGLTEKIIALRAGPGGEYMVAQQTHKARIDALQKELDITHDLHNYQQRMNVEGVEYQKQIADLDHERQERFASSAGGLAQALMSGTPGTAMRGFGLQLGRQQGTLFTENIARNLWGSVQNIGFHGLIPKQDTVDAEGEHHLTGLGKLLQGTMFGVDQSRWAKHGTQIGSTTSITAIPQNTSATTLNTGATTDLTAAIRQLIARLGGLTPGGGGPSYSPGSFPSFTPPTSSGGGSGGGYATDSNVMGYGDVGQVNYGDGAFAAPWAGGGGGDAAVAAGGSGMFDGPTAPFTNGFMDLGGGGEVSPLSPGLGASAATKGTGAFSRNVSRVAGAIAAGYGIYSGVRMGGARGVLTATSSALAGLSMIPGLQALAIPAMIGGLAEMFLGDPRQRRMMQESYAIRAARYVEPTPGLFTYTRYGQNAAQNMGGGANVSGNVTNLHINALDSRSILDRSTDIADALSSVIENRGSPRLASNLRSVSLTQY